MGSKDPFNTSNANLISIFLQLNLDEATTAWGIKVERVEM